MSKLKTVVITGIATLGTIGAGLTAVALIPSVKENVSVAVKGEHVYGTEQNTNNEKLKAELTAEKEKVAELTAIKTENEKTISDLNNSNTELHQQVDSLTSEVEETKGTVTNLENEVIAKNAELQEKQETVNSLTSQIEANNLRIAELEEQGLADSEEISNLTSANNSLNSQLTDLNNEISQLNTEKDLLNNQISNLNEDIQNKLSEIANLNNTIFSQSFTIDTLTASNNLLNEQITELNTQITSLQNRITELEEQIANGITGETWEQGLASRNLIAVNYILGDETILSIQNKDSIVNFELAPILKGYAFIGYKEKEGTNLTLTVDKNVDLYPVYIPSGSSVNFYNSLETEVFNYNKATHTLNDSYFTPYAMGTYGNVDVSLIGYSETEDGIIPVKEFNSSTTYYGIYYVKSERKIYSAKEMLYQYKVYTNGDFDVVIVKNNTCAYLDYMELDSFTSSFTVDSVKFEYKGLASSGDSTEVLTDLTASALGEIKTLYVVYTANGKDYSNNEVSSMLSTPFAERVRYIKENGLLTTTNYSQPVYFKEAYQFNPIINGIQFEFVGWSTNNKTEPMENIQNASMVYGIYKDVETGNLYNSSNFSNSLRYIKDNALISNGVTWFASEYEASVTIDGVQYDFVGWARDASSTSVVNISSISTSGAYAVYKNTETEERLNCGTLKTYKINYFNTSGKVSVNSLDISNFEVEETFIVNNVTYNFIGYSTSTSSTSTVDITTSTATTFYVVYEDTNGTKVSYNNLSSLISQYGIVIDSKPVQLPEF